MHSSISSSNQRLPEAQWLRILGGALLLYIGFVGFMEFRLSLRGFTATLPDSEMLWVKERQRASRLGKDALILVGSSRIQLGVDLNVLRTQTGLEPVQLAIDGSSFLPIFDSLASDPTIRGTVIVDFMDHLLIDPDPFRRPHAWQATYDRLERFEYLPDFAYVEGWLAAYWHRHLISYADGAKPVTSLELRLLPAKPLRQYLVTQSDRSRQADYSKVDMPEFYYRRLLRQLEQEIPTTPGMTYRDLEKAIRERVETLQPLAGSRNQYENNSRKLASKVAAIQERGGQVYFVMLPKSGMIWQMDDLRYPRALFWDRFISIIGAPAVHFEDVPLLSGFKCPDGSHLDYRQQAAFTRELSRALALNRSSENFGTK